MIADSILIDKDFESRDEWKIVDRLIDLIKSGKIAWKKDNNSFSYFIEEKFKLEISFRFLTGESYLIVYKLNEREVRLLRCIWSENLRNLWHEIVFRPK